MIHKHPREMMCLKPPSGIGRSAGYHRGDRALKREVEEMSSEDAFKMWRYERDLKMLGLERIKDFGEDMTPEQIRAKIIQIAQKDPSRAKRDFIDIIEIDGRYAPAKDAKYQGLIDALNGLDFSKMPGVRVNDRPQGYSNAIGYIPRGNGPRGNYDSFYEDIVTRLTSGYSSREIGDFVRKELGTYSIRSGREGAITTIALDLAGRMRSTLSGNDSGLRRLKLGDESSRVDKAVKTIQGKISDARMYRGRMDAIRAKYKKS